MRLHVWVLALLLSTTPAIAQDLEESVLRELGMGGTFAIGNLAVRDLQRGNDPVQQLKRFFAEARLPLTSAQERQLNSFVETQVQVLQGGSQNDETVRRVNQEFARKLHDVLSPDQQTTLRRYRTEQIMMRGGFPALKLILENGQTPFTLEQEKQAQAVYGEFNQEVDQLSRDSKGVPDRVQLDKLENGALAKVVKLMSPAQRRALAASRQGSLPKSKPFE